MDPFIDGASDSEGDRAGTIPGLLTKVVQCKFSGPVPQNKQFVLILPVTPFDMNRDAAVCYAQGLLAW